MNDKSLASIVIGISKPEKNDDYGAMYDDIAQGIIDAVKSEDAEALKTELKAFIEMCVTETEHMG